MTITLTTPETQANIDKVRLTSISANLDNNYMELTFEIGYLDGGNFVKVRTKVVTFSDDFDGADFTFTQLINNVPEAAALKQALEQAAIDFNVFAGTQS